MNTMKPSETQTTEFKQSWHDEYLKWICAYANAHGDKLVVESEGQDAPKARETISETIKSRPGISRADLIAVIGRSRSTVARAIAELVEAGAIERRGSKKTGGYYPKS